VNFTAGAGGIQEELDHSEQFGQRLKQLDARPPSSVVLEAKEAAIATYNDLIDAVEGFQRRRAGLCI
jgi:hypothetical protein